MKFGLAVLLISLMGITACVAATTDITIKRADGKDVVLHVERATDDASRERGLMFRTELGPDSGMLFIYEQPGNRAFWMKNTLIPLDMLFFTQSGELVYIQPSAVPKDLTPVGPSNRTDICAVLEIAGGQAAVHGLKPGDRLVLDDQSACLP